jgi:putative membrane protein
MSATPPPSSTDLAVKRTGLADLRSHLANERTHLAYLRTCVSLVGFGITLNRFAVYLREHDKIGATTSRRLLHNTENVGAGMIALGLALAVWSLYRYWHVNHDIQNASFRPMDRAVESITLLFILIGGITAAWLLYL